MGQENTGSGSPSEYLPYTSSANALSCGEGTSAHPASFAMPTTLQPPGLSSTQVNIQDFGGHSRANVMGIQIPPPLPNMNMPQQRVPDRPHFCEPPMHHGALHVYNHKRI